MLSLLIRNMDNLITLAYNLGKRKRSVLQNIKTAISLMKVRVYNNSCITKVRYLWKRRDKNVL